MKMMVVNGSTKKWGLELEERKVTRLRVGNDLLSYSNLHNLFIFMVVMKT